MYITSYWKAWSFSSLLILYLTSISSAESGCDLICIRDDQVYCDPRTTICPPCVGQRGENWYCSDTTPEGGCKEFDFIRCERDDAPEPTSNAPTTTPKRKTTPSPTKRSSLRPTGNTSSDSSASGDTDTDGDSSSSASNSSTQKPPSSSGSGSSSDVVDVPKTTKKRTPPPLSTSKTPTIAIPNTISPSPTTDENTITTESESSAISTPIIVGFIGAGIILLVGFALCCWKLQQDDEESEDEEDHQWNGPQVGASQKNTPHQYKQQLYAEEQSFGNFNSQSDGSGYSVDPYGEKFSGYYTGPVASQSPVPAAPATVASNYGYNSKTSDISGDNRLGTYSSQTPQRYHRSRSGFNQQNLRAPSNISVEF